MMKMLIRVCALLMVAGSAHAQAAGDPPAGDSVRVPILVYHSIAAHRAGQDAIQRQLDVDTGVFRKQMNYLAQIGDKVISLDALVSAIQHNTPVPDHAVVLTFDDSWLTQYEFAFPILHQLGFTATFFTITSAVGKDEGCMRWDQLKAMQAAGMTIAAHTRTHPKLTTMTPAQLEAEVAGSRADLQQNMGSASDLFAYPYGEWNPQVLAAVRAAGFHSARALSGGEWNGPSSLFALHAVLATDDMQLFERAVKGP